jgi:hypothetical protein
MPKSMCFTEMLLSSLAVCELLHSRIQSEMETSAKSHGLTATISMDRWAAYSDPTHGLQPTSYVVESAMAARPLSGVGVRPWRELFTFHGRAQPNCCSTSRSEGEGTPALGRREAIGRLIGAGIAGGVGWSSSTGLAKGGVPEVGLQQGRLRGCSGSSPCVSTSAFQSPSRFMPPWTVSPQ